MLGAPAELGAARGQIGEVKLVWRTFVRTSVHTWQHDQDLLIPNACSRAEGGRCQMCTERMVPEARGDAFFTRKQANLK